jgi:hypothetical protein
MTTAEAAAALSIDPSRVRKLIREGRLVAERQDTARGPIYHVDPVSVASFQRLPGGWPKGRPRKA